MLTFINDLRVCGVGPVAVGIGLWPPWNQKKPVRMKILLKSLRLVCYLESVTFQKRSLVNEIRP